MTLKYVKGNLLDTPDKIIVHGVNCQGVMGAGVAKAIRNKWPGVYDIYVKHVERTDNRYSLLGTNLLCGIGKVKDERLVVINSFTQFYYGTKSRQVDYVAIEKCFKEIAANVKRPISMPKIGCGLGGGDWVIVEGIIQENFEKDQVTVYEF